MALNLCELFQMSDNI